MGFPLRPAEKALPEFTGAAPLDNVMSITGRARWGEIEKGTRADRQPLSLDRWTWFLDRSQLVAFMFSLLLCNRPGLIFFIP